MPHMKDTKLRSALARFIWVGGLALIGSLTPIFGTSLPVARAQAVPVTDVANFALELTHNAAQEAVTSRTLEKMWQYYLAMRRLEDFSWRDIALELELLRALAEVEAGFGYGQGDLLDLFQASFPGYVGYASSEAVSWNEARRIELERQLATARNELRILQQHADLTGRMQAVLSAYRDALTSVRGRQEALDLLLSLSVYETEDYQLIRQLLASELALGAVEGASRVNDKAQRILTLEAALFGGERE